MECCYRRFLGRSVAGGGHSSRWVRCDGPSPRSATNPHLGDKLLSLKANELELRPRVCLRVGGNSNFLAPFKPTVRPTLQCILK